MADLSSDLLSRRRHVLDLSMVPHLELLRDDLPKGSLLVPRTLHQLLMGLPSPQLAQLLTIAILPRDPSEREIRELEITPERLNAVIAAYRRLVDSKVVKEIPDKKASDRAVLQLLDSIAAAFPSAPSVPLPGGTRITPRGLVRTHLNTMLDYSKRNGTAILALGRSLPSRIRGKLPVLELPDELTNLRQQKKELKKKYLIKSENAETAALIANLGLCVAAFFALPPVVGHAIGAAGFVLTIVDP